MENMRAGGTWKSRKGFQSRNTPGMAEARVHGVGVLLGPQREHSETYLAKNINNTFFFSNVI